jgi:hypothetical protein
MSFPINVAAGTSAARMLRRCRPLLNLTAPHGPATVVEII